MKKVCVLQPDYSTADVDYKNYDPPRSLSHLLAGWEVDHVFLNKLTVYRQLRELKKKRYDIFVNLCEGYADWPVPSVDVIHSLESLNLPFTGPSSLLYDPPKDLMKYVAYCCGVSTPAYVKISEATAPGFDNGLHYPLFVKPAHAGDSLGIDGHSLVTNAQELVEKTRALFTEYDELLVEEYIAGREFTVLVAANAHTPDCTVYTPLEYVFPEGITYKTYALKTSELHEECNVPCTDPCLAGRLKDAAAKIFRQFGGVGYARMDFRVDGNGAIFFLEINFTCSVFYEDGYEGSADHILLHEPEGKKAFLEKIIEEGIWRHRQKQKKYILKGDAISGYGIYALSSIRKDEVIFHNEGAPHRLVTKKFVEKNWSDEDKMTFRKYAWPVSREIYVLWDADPAAWAPQNHSCDPNTAYDGLNVIALKDIGAGEELTLDYAAFLDHEMESFVCNCGSPRCRKIIRSPENSLPAE